MQASEDGKAEESQQLSRVRAKSLAAVDALMLTDAPLLFPPGQLALAALRSGMKAVRDSWPLDKLVGKGHDVRQAESGNPKLWILQFPPLFALSWRARHFRRLICLKSWLNCKATSIAFASMAIFVEEMFIWLVNRSHVRRKTSN